MTESLLAVYCVLIVGASAIGGWLPALMQMTHLRTQLLMSFVAGLMLGIALLHMLPHSLSLLDSGFYAGAAALVGIIAMFILLRAFHTHAHTDIEEHGHTNPAQHDHHHDHSHSAGDGHHHDHHSHTKQYGWLGMLFGLGLHTLMDGVALAASVAAESLHQTWLGLAGLGTFLAVMLHKPLDAFAITAVMKKDGWTPVQQTLVNMTFSMTCPIGALLFFFGASHFSNDVALLGWGLAVSAGFFICIALADLLPEVAFHDPDRFKLTVALLLGVALAVGIENLPSHNHDHDHVQNSSQQVAPLQ